MPLHFGKDRKDPRSTLFREIVTLIESDHFIRSLCKPSNIRSWKGTPDDAQELGIAQAPALRFTPIAHGREEWYSPESQMGTLVIETELVTAGYDVTDVMNLWYCVERAVYPKGHSQAVADRLKAAGSFTGLVEFQPPTFAAAAASALAKATAKVTTSDGFFMTAYVRCDYLHIINT